MSKKLNKMENITKRGIFSIITIISAAVGISLSIILYFNDEATVPADVVQTHQQMASNCSSVNQDIEMSSSVMITCTGISKAALKKLNELLNSTETIANLNTQLTLQDKIKLAEGWQQRYLDLETRLLGKESDALEQQAAKALQAGNLVLAGELLDQLIAKQEQVANKQAANHFRRARVFQLQYEPVQALPHLKKAYRYRSEKREYAFAYALLLQKQNQFKQAIPIYEKILQHDRELGDEFNIATTLNNLGLLYNKTNSYKPAEKHFLEALAIYRKLAKNSPDAFEEGLAKVLYSIGILHYKMNQPEKAAKYLNESLTLIEKLAKKYPEIYGKRLND